MPKEAIAGTGGDDGQVGDPAWNMSLPMASRTFSLSPGSAPPVSIRAASLQGGTNEFLRPFRGFGHPEAPIGGDGKRKPMTIIAAGLCRRFGAMVVFGVGSNLVAGRPFAVRKRVPSARSDDTSVLKSGPVRS